MGSNRYDYAKRRQGRRKQRERGIHVYITGDELSAAGFDPHGPPPFYRVWGTKRGGVMIRLYKKA
jgi:hypothetical protein